MGVLRAPIARVFYYPHQDLFCVWEMVVRGVYREMSVLRRVSVGRNVKLNISWNITNWWLKIHSRDSPDEELSINRSFGILLIRIEPVCHWPKVLQSFFMSQTSTNDISRSKKSWELKMGALESPGWELSGNICQKKWRSRESDPWLRECESRALPLS